MMTLELFLVVVLMFMIQLQIETTATQSSLELMANGGITWQRVQIPIDRKTAGGQGFF